MGSSNISVTHSETGLVVADVVRAERISSHFVRVTVASDALENWRHLGFDQWFRLAVPASENTRFDNMSQKFNMSGYVKYLTLPKATRPIVRSYTVREFRPESREIDIDFVVHGTEGVAGPWAETLPVGAQVGIIDQGCGYTHRPDADTTLLVGDESALPAVIGILRDLPRDAKGTAIIEVPAEDDLQPVDAPEGMAVEWVIRDGSSIPGAEALASFRALGAPAGSVSAFAAGESKLATGARRFLVSENGVGKDRVDFCGYWRI